MGQAQGKQRRFTREFKVSAVQLVNQQGYSVAEAAKSLGVDASSVRCWIGKFSKEEGVAARRARVTRDARRWRRRSGPCTRRIAGSTAARASGGRSRPGARAPARTPWPR